MKTLERSNLVTILFFVCFSLLSVNLLAQEKELEKEDDGFRWYMLRQGSYRGAQTVQGATIIPLSREYDFICYHDSDGGWFSVRRNGKTGACDKDGKEVIAPFKFEKVYFRRGDNGFEYYKVELSGKEGICNKNGEEIIEPKYDNVYYYDNDGYGYYEVKLNGKEGVCDMVGKEIIVPNEYDDVCYHSIGKGVGYFGVKFDGKKGACDMNGIEIIEPKYGSLFYSSQSKVFKYKDASGNTVSLDITLKEDDTSIALDGVEQQSMSGVVIEQGSLRKSMQTENDGFVWYLIKQDSVFGVEDIDGNVRIPLNRGYKIVSYLDISGGQFIVKKADKMGVCDKVTGKEIIAPNKYDIAIYFNQDGFAYCLVSQNQKYGVCDLKGHEIIVPKYDMVVFNYYEGYFSVQIDGKNGVCDKKGKEIIAPIYDNVLCFSDEKYFQVEIDGKKGILGLNGKEIIAPEFDNIVYFSDDEYFMVESNEKKGVYNKNGKKIIIPEYDNVYYISFDEYYMVELQGKKGVCDKDGKEKLAPQYESLIYDDENGFEYQNSSGDWVALGVYLNNRSKSNNAKLSREEKVMAVLQVLGAVADVVQQYNNHMIQQNSTAVQPTYYNSSNNVNHNHSAPQTKSRTVCAHCEGTGRCRYCGGTHVRTNQFSHEKVECIWCNSNGDCHWCHGKGVIQ